MAGDGRASAASGWVVPSGERLRRDWPYLAAAGLTTAATLAVLWYAGRALLLAGAGILVAALLGAASDGVSRLTGLGRRACLAITCLAILAALAAIGLSAVPDMVEQAQRLVGELRKIWGTLSRRIEDFAWGREALAQLEQGGSGDSGGVQQVAQQALGFASATVNGLVNLLIVLIIGIYLAAEPDTYLKGIVKLVPLPKRPRAREVLLEMAHTLRAWLLGQLAAMAVIGVASGLGLWLLGVPFALMLGLVAGLFAFIPNIGPLLGLAPALLVAFGVSPWHPLYVLILYSCIQTVESYLLTPMIQRRAVNLPPALLITVQVAAGLLAGVLGLLLATPFAAVALVVVRMVYVEDTLHDPHPED